MGLCKDAAALKKAGFGSYPEAQLPSSKAITASLRERADERAKKRGSEGRRQGHGTTSKDGL